MKGIRKVTIRNCARGILVAVALTLVFPSWSGAAEVSPATRLVLQITELSNIAAILCLKELKREDTNAS
jgi:hypothetical protein